MRVAVPLILLAGCIAEVPLPGVTATAASVAPKMGEKVLLSATTDDATAGFEWTVVRRPGGSLATFSSDAVASPTFTPDREGLYELAVIAKNATRRSRAASVGFTVAGDCMPDIEPSTLVEGSRVVFPAAPAGCDPGVLDLQIDAAPAGSAASPSADGFVPDVPGSYSLAYARVRGGGLAPAAKHVMVTVSACATSVSISAIPDYTVFYGAVNAQLVARATSMCPGLLKETHLSVDPGSAPLGTTHSGVDSATYSSDMLRCLGTTGTTAATFPCFGNLRARAAAVTTSGRVIEAARDIPYLGEQPRGLLASLGVSQPLVRGNLFSLAFFETFSQGLHIAEPDLQTGAWLRSAIDVSPVSGDSVGANVGFAQTDTLTAAVYRRTISAVTTVRYAERALDGQWRYRDDPFINNAAVVIPYRLLIDSASRRHVFSLIPTFTIGYSRCEAQNCAIGAWTAQSPVLSPAMSLPVFDVKERGNILYFAYVSGAGPYAINLAQCSATSCTGALGVSQAVATGLTAEPAVALGFDATGVALVAYSDTSGTLTRKLKVRRCAPSCESGTTEIPDELRPVNSVQWLQTGATSEPLLVWSYDTETSNQQFTVRERTSAGLVGKLLRTPAPAGSVAVRLDDGRVILNPQQPVALELLAP